MFIYRRTRRLSKAYMSPNTLGGIIGLYKNPSRIPVTVQTVFPRVIPREGKLHEYSTIHSIFIFYRHRTDLYVVGRTKTQASHKPQQHEPYFSKTFQCFCFSKEPSLPILYTPKVQPACTAYKPHLYIHFYLSVPAVRTQRIPRIPTFPFP